MNALPLFKDEFRPISPWREMGAYEALWNSENSSFKSIAETFARAENLLPSDLVEPTFSAELAAKADSAIKAFCKQSYGIRVHGEGEYPERLREAKHPVELLYFQGLWALTETPSVAIVGTRSPSEDSIKRTRQITKALIEKGFTIVSGLAKGIDHAAHTSAIEFGGWTIAVIGTPLSMAYPKEHSDLQFEIAKNHLLISQVPVVSYPKMKFTKKRLFFPERNVTMSALTQATIIVEAGNTSGTLTQARAAIEQGRKLFILNSSFEKSELTWPDKFAAKGAIRVRSIDDILENLDAPDSNRRNPTA
jgi:DNA processing protein